MNIFVTLGNAKDGKSLTKMVADEYLEGNFDNMYQYMIDESPDELNPGYKPEDTRVLNMFKECYQNSGNSENSFGLAYLRADTGNHQKVRLLDIVKDQEAILHKGEEIFGEISEEHHEIQLYTSFIPNGGGNESY